jgi:transcriptional regulator with XRE-family HTH domain
MQGAGDKERDPADAIAATLRRERETRQWSLAELAERSGVSKAMISKIERQEANPTATVLGRLSGAFGLPLSVLIASAERAAERLRPSVNQPVWTDPETGYVRRAVSPAGASAELIEVSLPPSVRVPYPASAFAFQQQQILVLEGCLDFSEGDVEHRLGAGDCLLLGSPSDCAFFNPGPGTARYLVVLTRR